MNKITELIKKEEQRQRETLMMIPSENYTYKEAREALGSVFVHKYAEGQPYKRYYQGNENVDEIESYTESLALEVFGLDPKDWSINVQPYSGSPANLAVYNALLNPGDKIMSMALPEGGHLSHGWQTPTKKISLVSKIYDVEFYHVDPKSQVFDYSQIESKAVEFKPKLIISGGTAYPREIDHKRLSEIAKKVGAYYMADVAHEAGLIAGGSNSSPFSYADVVTMTTHKTLRGPRGAMIFSRHDLSDAIDFSVFPGIQGGPHMHTIAGIAVALENAKSQEFKDYAKQTVVNARALAQSLKEKGFDLVGDGTDKHLVLINLTNKNLNGWFVAWALEKAGIIANRNTIPGDSSTAYYPSGLRLGTPALTVRGMKDTEMKTIAGLIDDVVNHLEKRELPEDKDERAKYLKDFKLEIEKDEFLKDISGKVAELCQKFPVDF